MVLAYAKSKREYIDDWCHLLGVFNFEGPTAGNEPPLGAQKREPYIKHTRNYFQHYQPSLFCNQVTLFRGGGRPKVKRPIKGENRGSS